ncbi:acyl-CoA thioesterase/bile acid-CoA:amino acid N-acyltransferase family protein [Lentzea sp. NEAU-D7]|uniref:acyl-CoA thioesterase/bile acid-CoA:amino acid N-acyltransferase family protein n=1 Tax=Lentzea sp. NEAU-D7 TaxID=2994667 RepID=UPI00224B0BA1|nr:acyl-CoA thioesterase/bile acid-CoA:amino acid N-acyltransferase family protein [Lentzea sp. NEAU-D7]MCX2949883.1 acyl-CoA thioesterase/bile acid-CoA:amino acid N-acyltransferase family protein [Lentzea sp. NEAU-D7]
MAEILVSPLTAPLDRQVDVVVAGLEPGQSITVQLSTGDRASRAVFEADDRGVVDLTRHAPVDGSYDGVDPMGLFWSLERTGGKAGPTVLSVEGVGDRVLDRQSVPEGVERLEVREHGLVGTLFAPEDDGGELPGVIVLGGSEGGLQEADAALLAAHGFVTFALGYFGVDGLPEHLEDVPLEYFGKAIEHLSERAGEIGVVGGSRGGELALLVGSKFSQVSAVVSVVGSGVVTQAIGPGANLLQKLQHEAASWTWKGEPLPYLPYYVGDELRAKIVNGEPVPLRLAFDTSDGIPEDTEIPVENIAGGVLLISSGQDDGWPSAELSDVAMRRLKDHEHPFPYEHVVYPEAGHLIAGPPHRPATDVTYPGPGVTFSGGGVPQATARARANAWKRTVEFLREQLGS